jgi:hypothetical protein
MGNRALVIFYDNNRISPSVYLHWYGGEVPGLLGDLAVLMQGRTGDAEYAAARFIGLCHNLIEGNLSLGVYSNALTTADLQNQKLLEEMSPGDAGVVIVNTGDFSWNAYGGYLAERRWQKKADSQLSLIPGGA